MCSNKLKNYCKRIGGSALIPDEVSCVRDAMGGGKMWDACIYACDMISMLAHIGSSVSMGCRGPNLVMSQACI